MQEGYKQDQRSQKSEFDMVIFALMGSIREGVQLKSRRNFKISLCFELPFKIIQKYMESSMNMILVALYLKSWWDQKKIQTSCWSFKSSNISLSCHQQK